MKTITSGQQSQFANVVGDAARKGATASLTPFVDSGELNSENFQGMLGFDGFAPAIKEFTREWITSYLEMKAGGCTRLISGEAILELDASDGSGTIAEAKNVFGWIDPDFRNWSLNVKGKPTTKTRVSVREMRKDGTFPKIFTGINPNLDRLCFEQDQIPQFCVKHRKWLRTDGYGTFFLFKRGEDFFVADVGVDDDGSLDVSVYEFSRGVVWDAEYRRRFVVPQLDTLAS